MKYRKFDHIEKPASLFGLGCMRFNGAASGDSIIDEEKAIRLIRQAIDGGVTYIDTAYVYLDQTSETVLGKALRDGYREKVMIATKMPIEHVHNRNEMEELLTTELEKLQTEYVDFYLMHGIDKEKWLQFKAMGADQFFTDMKKEGKIRNKCFSFHGSYEDFAYILNDFDWDMVQIQYNFMDIEHQAGTKGLKLAGEKGIPVVIMEGLLGGKLANAPSNVQVLYDSFSVKRSPVEWAFRWLADNPEIMTILSGCNEAEQIADNLRIFESADVNCMTEEEHALIAKVRDAYNDRTKIGCTGCRYCMPCSGGIDIPRVFAAWNECSLYQEKPENNWNYTELIRLDQTPAGCLQCGECIKACPQHLEIIDSLQRAWSEMSEGRV